MQATRNNAATPKSPPNIDEAMYLSLKAHILRLREKRKQEQEQDAAMERHKRDLELKRKRDALSLEEVNDQMAKLEVKLKHLKDEKNELFLQLKRVWNDDEKRKKKQEEAQSYTHSIPFPLALWPGFPAGQLPPSSLPQLTSIQRQPTSSSNDYRLPSKVTVVPVTPSGPISMSVPMKRRHDQSPPPIGPSVRGYPPFQYYGAPAGPGYPNPDGSFSNSNNNSVINDEVKSRSKDQRQSQQGSQSQQPSHPSSSMQTNQPPYTRYM